jgi:hypothetical protein
MWRTILRYNSQIDQAFGQVFLVASAVAILLWSVSIVRSSTLARGVGIFGCLLGPLMLVAVFSGLPNRSPHGFAVVVLGQALWFIIVGALLCQVRDE